MRIQSPSSIPFLLLAPTLVSSSSSSSSSSLDFDCENIVADGVKYNLGPLGGAHSVYHVEETDDAVLNTTFVLNVCGTLRSASSRGELDCGKGKNVCGFEYTKSLDNSQILGKAYPIVGGDRTGHGGSRDPEVTRLKKLDADREGLLLKMYGGELPDTAADDGDKSSNSSNNNNGSSRKKKKNTVGAMIEFKCDPERSGLENVETVRDDGDGGDESEEEKRSMSLGTRTAAIGTATKGKGSDETENNGTRSLQFRRFGPVSENNGTYMLELDWYTRYACDNYLKDKKNGQSSSSGGGLGVFSWMIIILFLCIATYLIFGSWLNYNRYGARGWDLLPHGDTIRDIPYLFQDWLRRIVNSLQGTGTRGGYSAV